MKHREGHEAERQLQDRAFVAKQAFLGNTPAIEKQERRKEEEKKNIRVQVRRAGRQWSRSRLQVRSPPTERESEPETCV